VSGNVQTLKSLLSQGASVSDVDEVGETLLHKAARVSAECVYLILSHDADINVQDVSGDTPLHRAAWAGQIECVKQLVTRGADTQIRNVFGHTPVEVAVISSSHACVDFLECGESDDDYLLLKSLMEERDSRRAVRDQNTLSFLTFTPM